MALESVIMAGTVHFGVVFCLTIFIRSSMCSGVFPEGHNFAITTMVKKYGLVPCCFSFKL